MQRSRHDLAQVRRAEVVRKVKARARRAMLTSLKYATMYPQRCVPITQGSRTLLPGVGRFSSDCLAILLDKNNNVMRQTTCTGVYHANEKCLVYGKQEATPFNGCKSTRWNSLI
jgi:hypothetical protein